MRLYIWGLISVALAICSTPMLVQGQNDMEEQQLFQLRIYHFDHPGQEAAVDEYLESAYLPALHRAGIEPVGVFKPLDTDTTSDRRTYLLIPFDTFEEMHSLYGILQNDQQYMAAATDYLELGEDTAPYSYFENILLEAFELAPVIHDPALEAPREERVYELRDYGSPTRALNINKVEMFNEGGEIELFDDLGFDYVFYGNVIAGSEMPNLIYLTVYESMESRNELWNDFFNSPGWDTLSSMERYQGNVSRVDSRFLQSASYSDL